MTRHPRILIIDDNGAIHADFRKILAPPTDESVALSALEDALFGAPPAKNGREHYEIVSAYQGEEGFNFVQSAEDGGEPFAVAFVDIRMPPGWDGIETIKQLLVIAPHLQFVICTAFSDYSPEVIAEQLGDADELVVLHKPVDPLEVQVLAARLVTRWNNKAATVRKIGSVLE